MKKSIFAVAILALASTGVFAQGKKLEAAPKVVPTQAPAATNATEPATTIKFKTETHDFGTLQEGDPAEAEFVFTNTGKKTFDHSKRSAWLRMYYALLV